MADWVTISQVATAGGTLVLAFATFSSVRSANRSARVAELSLMAGLRPLLIPSREEDPSQRVRFGDGQILIVPGHGAAIELANDNVYMAIALRNGGSGLAVIHGWHTQVLERTTSTSIPAPETFRPQQRDLYIPAGDTGFWQGAIRDRADPDYAGVRDAAREGRRVMVDLLYGDYEGGQRTITRIAINPSRSETEGTQAEVLRYWNVDRADPRERPSGPSSQVPTIDKQL
jgi:hypothetical protein